MHEDDIGRADRHIRAGTDRDAHTGTGEGRCIVYAIPYHCDLVALALELVDLLFLLVRKDACHDLIDADLGGDDRGGLWLVACEHDRADAHLVETRDSGGRGRLHDIGNSDERLELPISRNEERSLSRSSCVVCCLLELFDSDAALLHESGIADEEFGA